MSTSSRARAGIAAFVAVTLLVAGCGSDGDAAGDGASGNGDVVEVVTLDNTFNPETVKVEPGATVRWVNEGRNAHNVVAVDEDAGFGVDTDEFLPGDSYDFTFADEGAWAYYCTIHGTPDSGQRGQVVVGKADEVASDDDAKQARPDGETLTIEVPGDEKTIQDAVDAALPGDLILVSPGVYEEAVTVTTDNLTIRGLDRNEVILDGGFELENGIRVVDADGVAVENMTARNYTTNGFFWTGVTGYRGSYLTAYRNGDYGVYAFDSTVGQFDHSYASGSPDAGFYIGQCYPCDAVITDVVSEYNGLGYSGTNAGGNLLIVNSVFRFNRAGIVPNSGDYEANPPERETTIVGNLVYSNNQEDTPAIDSAMLAMGNGILIGGGIDNIIERNLVIDHDLTGISAVPLPDKNIWPSERNRVIGNVVEDSRIADLAIVSNPESGNCFSGNTFATSDPPDIENVLPCDGDYRAFSPATDFLDQLVNRSRPPAGDFETQPIPPPQPGMDDPAGAPANPATPESVPMAIDLAAIVVPTRPDGL